MTASAGSYGLEETSTGVARHVWGVGDDGEDREGYRYELVEVAARRSGELHGEGALLRETRKKRHQMMRRYSAEPKIPRGGAGDYFTGRKRRCTVSW